jgi:MinD-like ATPase involved in chromosome partitioning or flagellar assembly
MSKIISIHSFRGGTGKSNITANVATIAARRGRRVGIIDTDIQSPGIHVLFGLDEKRIDRTLNDYLWGRCTVEEAAYDVADIASASDRLPDRARSTPAASGAILEMGEGEVAVMGGGIHLIPSSLKAGEIARVLREGYDVGVLGDGFQELLRRLDLDCLFIDTHPGLNEETLLSIAISDILIVILRPDQQDYQGTAVTVDVARKLEIHRMFLVVNKALPGLDFDDVRGKMERAYGCEVAAVLPLSEDMVRLASGGIFCLRHPVHPLTQGLNAIADRILEGG